MNPQKKNANTNIIYGRNSIKEALRADKVIRLFTMANFSDKEITPLIQQKHIVVKVVSQGELDAMSNGGVHQGIAAEAKRYEYVDLDEIIRRSRKETLPIIVHIHRSDG